MPRHIGAQALQDLEELGAAVRFAVEGHQQGLLRPAAALAPRCVEHRFVQQRAQHVARGGDRFHRRASIARTVFEAAHLRHHLLAQAGHIGRLRTVAQLHRQQQQRRGGLHQRVDAAAQQFADVGVFAGHAGAPCGRQRCGVGWRQIGNRSAHAQLRIAHNCRSNPANSLPKWNAIPPEVFSVRHNAALLSNSKYR